jgi:hypothetical protein
MDANRQSSGTQFTCFTCFTGTKVQILTLRRHQARAFGKNNKAYKASVDMDYKMYNHKNAPAPFLTLLLRGKKRVSKKIARLHAAYMYTEYQYTLSIRILSINIYTNIYSKYRCIYWSLHWASIRTCRYDLQLPTHLELRSAIEPLFAPYFQVQNYLLYWYKSTNTDASWLLRGKIRSCPSFSVGTSTGAMSQLIQV